MRSESVYSEKLTAASANCTCEVYTMVVSVSRAMASDAGRPCQLSRYTLALYAFDLYPVSGSGLPAGGEQKPRGPPQQMRARVRGVRRAANVPRREMNDAIDKPAVVL